MMLRTKYQGSRPFRGFREEDFFMFSLCKTCDPWGGPIFGQRGIICINLV